MVVDTLAEAPKQASPNPDWRFLIRPFWLFSHVFVAASVVLFISLGFWQLSRLDDRQAQNAEVLSAIDAPQVRISTADEIDELVQYRRVEVVGAWSDSDFARIISRSQNGVAGEYVVAILTMDDGSSLAVNRGFVGLNDDRSTEGASGSVTVEGWVQPSVVKGRFGQTDTMGSELMPRFDTQMVSARFGEELPKNWLQVAPDPQSGVAPIPDPVPLPPIDSGPHFGYAMQWFTFAVLTVAFYIAMLRRKAHSTTSFQEPETLADPLG